MKRKCETVAARKKDRRRKRLRRIWKTVCVFLMVLGVLFVCDRIFLLDVPVEENNDLGAEEKSENINNTDIEVSQTELEDETTKLMKNAEQILDDMTLEERVFQMFIVTQEQLTGVSPVTQSGETSKLAIEKYPVGGIVYFAANLVSREQCTTMIQNIQSYSKIGLFIAVDEEGGKVARLGNQSEMGTTAFPPMGSIGNSEDTSKAYEVGYVIGKEISELGFNLDFAPVADVYSNIENTVIGDRAFSNDPQIAAEMVSACVLGFRDSGMLCTLKHFPGHGDTTTDSHYGAATITKSLEELYECELIPFQAGIDAGAPFVMVGHLTALQITEEDVPVTLSHDLVTGLLREQMGFQDIIITDSMSMQAITDYYSAGDAAVKAVQAGVDMILMPQNLQESVNGILSAVENGVITEERINESVLRILQVKISQGIIEIENQEM